jgi:hypothetical protein
MIQFVAIKCKTCNSKWRLALPLNDNQIESLAAICTCGNIIVGNYKSRILKIKSEFSKMNYLSNGGFDFLDYSEEELEKLANLPLE